MAPTGLTRDTSWQIGVRKTLPIGLEDAWELLLSQAGLCAWLGDLPEFKAGEGAVFELPDGTKGKFTIYKQLSHVRLQWHPLNYTRYSIIQVRVIPAGADKTVFSFHQEHLPGEKAREERRAFFKNTVMEIERLTGDDRATDS